MKIIFFIVLAVSCTHLKAQETILMPTQAEWDKYIDGRIIDLQRTIYKLAMSSRIKAYKTAKMNRSSFYTIEVLDRFTRGIDFVEVLDTSLSTAEEPVYKVIEILKDFSADSFEGFCFFEQQDSNLNSSSISIELKGVAPLMRAWLAGGVRDINRYPAFWLKKEELYKHLNPQDTSFINHLYRIANYGYYHLTTQFSRPQWREYINEELFRKNGKAIMIDTGFLKLPKAILGAAKRVQFDIKGPVYDVLYEKFYPAEYFLVDRYETFEFVEMIDDEKSTWENPVFKSIKIPEVGRLPPPHSLTFSKINKLNKIILRLDTTGITLKDKLTTKKPFYQFEIPITTIEANYNLRNLTWWLEDYYLWKKKKNK